jgi:hypothetical protein
MAVIDKIYGTNKEWEEFFFFLATKRPQYCRFLYPPFGYENSIRPISNFPQYADRWLYDNCPLKWVKKRIKEQYNGRP